MVITTTIATTLSKIAKTIDPSTTNEEVSMGAARLRPGGITTGALVDAKCVAVDVGIPSQAKRTPTDPVHQSAIQQAAKHITLLEGDLQQEDILFRAAIWSQEGRPERDARQVLDGMTNMAHKYVPGANDAADANAKSTANASYGSCA